MTVTISDVRMVLKNLPDEFVSDEVVEKQIEFAEFTVEHEKSSSATDDEIDKAVTLNAAHLTLLAYASEIERSLGIVAPSLGALIERYKMLADKALEYIRRGSKVKEPYFDTPYSLWEYAVAIDSRLEDYL